MAEFVLDLVENPHPAMLRLVLSARSQKAMSLAALAYYNGMVDVMAAATGESIDAIEGWIKAHE